MYPGEGKTAMYWLTESAKCCTMTTLRVTSPRGQACQLAVTAGGVVLSISVAHYYLLLDLFCQAYPPFQLPMAFLCRSTSMAVYPLLLTHLRGLFTLFGREMLDLNQRIWSITRSQSMIGCFLSRVSLLGISKLEGEKQGEKTPIECHAENLLSRILGD